MTSVLPRRRLTAGTALCALAAFAACTDKSPTRPEPGSLEVVVNATGTDADERFSIQVNTGAAEAYTAGTRFVREGLNAGTYTVRLSGVSSNCVLQGADAVQVSVPAGERARATFTLACSMRWLVVTRFAYDATGSRLFRMNRDGTGVVALSPNPGMDFYPSISPDGTRIAFTSLRDGNAEIYVVNADGSNARRLTTLPTSDGSPAWSPDGTRIAFISESFPEPSQVRVMNADGTGVTTVASGLTGVHVPLRWSPDGARLALMIQQIGSPDANVHTVALATGAVARVTSSPMPDMDPGWLEDGRLTYLTLSADVVAGVAAINADGSNRTILYDNLAHVEGDPAVSLDGKWVTYTTTPEGGGWMELWVSSVPGTPIRISTGSHHEYPAWQP